MIDMVLVLGNIISYIILKQFENEINILFNICTLVASL